MNLNLKQKLFGSKLKKIVWSVVLFTAILCATFIRIIPDYSTSRGFAVVSLSDYNKYKQGYCLKEDRILPKDELYRRAIGKRLDNYIIFEKLLDKYAVYKLGSSWGSKYEIAYYELENISLSNWFEVLHNYYKEGKDNEEIFMNELKAKKVDPKKYLKINLKDMSAGFDRPIARIEGDNRSVNVTLFLDNYFLLGENMLQYNYFKYLVAIWFDEKVKREYQKHKNILFDKKRSFTRIDNCGNIDEDVKKSFNNAKENIGKGG